jgi:Domain of unknown function (DUF4160)
VPTVLRIGPYRFFFYSNERGEPPHIHVSRGNQLAKFWLEPVSVVRSRRFAAHELNIIRQHIEANLEPICEAWHEHHGG